MSPYQHDHELFRAAFRAYLERAFAPHLDDWERAGELPIRDVYAGLGREGFLGLECPLEYGGLGLDAGYGLVRAEELGRLGACGLAMSLMVHLDLCLPALAQHGSASIRKRFLRPVARGEAIGCLAVTEPTAGTDVLAMTTEARREGDHWVVNGSKCYITNGSIADFAIVFCRTGPREGAAGLTALVVPSQSQGFTATRTDTKLGNRSCDHAELALRDVSVPDDHTLGTDGQGYQILTDLFVRDRLMWGGLAYGLARYVLNQTLIHTRRRIVMGGRLIDQQSVAFTLVDLEVEIECLHGLIRDTLPSLRDGQSCVRDSARVKLKASQVLMRTTDACLQLFGGAGYMEDLPVTRVFRDGRAVALAGGTPDAMRHLLAHWLDYD